MKIMDNYDNHGRKIFKQLPDSIPSIKLSEQWAEQVHGQSLTRLNDRGGMSILELIMNIKKFKLDELIRQYGYNYKPTEKDANELLSLLNS